MKGTVKKVLGGKRYGFVRAENGGEYFFHKEDFIGHWDDLVTDFEGGNLDIPLTFETAESSKGPRARNVKRLDFPNEAV